MTWKIANWIEIDQLIYNEATLAVFNDITECGLFLTRELICTLSRPTHTTVKYTLMFLLNRCACQST